jgi:hypothetical protein
MGVLRSVSMRLRGHRHGPVTRLISPSGLGKELKPFIFLDYFNSEIIRIRVLLPSHGSRAAT